MKLYEQITEKLRQQITAGELAPGDKMPSINELKNDFNVSHVTVLRVYRELASFGLVSSKHGQGYYVCDDLSNSPPVLGRIGCFTRALRKIDFADNYFNEINIGIQLKAGMQRVNLLYPHAAGGLNTNPSNSVFEELQREMLGCANLVDGYLIDERIPDEIVDKVMKATGKPVVIVNRESALPVNTITNDNEHAVATSLELGRKMGYSQFIFCAVGPVKRPVFNNILGHRAFLEQAPPKYRAIVDDTNILSLEATLNNIDICYRERRKLGRVLILCTDQLGRNLVDRYFPGGRPADSDLGIIGQEGFFRKPEVGPSLTVSKINAYEIGETALEILLNSLDCSNKNSQGNHRVKPTLELGNSM